MIADLLIATVLLPAVCAAVFLAAGLWPPPRPEIRQEEGEAPCSWGTLVAVGAAYAAAQFAIVGLPAFPPTTAVEWLFHGTMASIIAASLQWTWPRSLLAGCGPRLIIVVACTWMMTRPLAEYSWEPAQTALHVVALSIGWFVLWSVLDRGTRDAARRRWWPLVAAVLAGGSGGVLMLSGSAKYGQLAGAVGVACVVWWLISLVAGGARAGAGSAAVTSFLIGGLAVAGYLFAEVPWTSLALMLLAPVGAEIGARLTRGSEKKWVRAAAEVILTGALVGAAIAPPLVATLTAEDTPYY